MARRVMRSVVLGLGVALAGDASALTIVSQEADLQVSSYFQTAEWLSETDHIDGLDPIDRTLTSEQGDPEADPPGWAAATTHLETDFGPDSLYIGAWVSADAIWDGSLYPGGGGEDPASAGGFSDLVIHFRLDQGTGVQGDLNGAANVTLSHDTLGFDLYWTAPDGDYGFECGSIPDDLFGPSPCFDFFGEMPTSGILPAGDYTLTAETFAFEDDPRPGSCNVGCGYMGFDFSLVFVPEPGTGTLLGAGLSVLAARRGRGRRR